jgi:hypothetical protein
MRSQRASISTAGSALEPTRRTVRLPSHRAQRQRALRPGGRVRRRRRSARPSRYRRPRWARSRSVKRPRGRRRYAVIAQWAADADHVLVPASQLRTRCWPSPQRSVPGCSHAGTTSDSGCAPAIGDR